MTSPANLFAPPDPSIDPASLIMICGSVALAWLMIAGTLALASRTRRATHSFRCPLLRRQVTVDSREWGGRMLDVRGCSGLRPAHDFALCGKRCLDEGCA